MKFLKTDQAPQAIGPYSQAVEVHGMVYVSGQIALKPQSKELVDHRIEQQTLQVLKNIEAILTNAGLTKFNIVKTTVFLKSLGDFKAMNQVYEDFFEDHKPARATVEVSKLPKDALVEIEAIAMRE